MTEFMHSPSGSYPPSASIAPGGQQVNAAAQPAAAVQPIISARSLSKTYGFNPVLHQVSLDIFPGQSVAIMGPSGSGKTTLLHILSGIIQPDAGSVFLRNAQGYRDIAAMSNAERTALRASHFGFVFQQGLLVPELTASENIALSAMLAGMSRSQARTRAQQLLQQLGLGALGNRRIGELSGGQAQRVAIARAQVNDAPIIFADEPTGALDSATAREVMQVLLNVTTSNTALVIVTHDPAVAQACQRVIHVRDGVIVSDSAQQTQQAPQNTIQQTPQAPAQHQQNWGA
ncbi:MAG: ABC transporter ATP-binding protein [Rothia sp. (in: high G+C Gram-positive bacteria)]|uniref:ABC transporter ATP-binding protein n=1 Tax=Rothia sp. (in: high G+C Gram-positive bacteria) TaxID=1885016 RepID=UPI0026DF7E91|nr:ABC transporter ATP-binding protein [Rothia sp. (in: high G+C Gram-positive bacteria)]MDO5749800.1 ABC transporter ATP-binding protein [Rothia sp. (in: high G+C Gram-positive bacteria)]